MYQAPSGKDFRDKASSVRYYFAKGKSHEEISELTGIKVGHVKICMSTFEKKGFTIEDIDPETGMMKSVVEKQQLAETKKKAAEVKSKQAAMKAQDKESEKPAKKKTVAKKKVAKKK